jgi:hypothetical protein
MEDERELKQISNNLDFYVLFHDELLSNGYSEERIMEMVDKLLDRMIEVMKKRS